MKKIMLLVSMLAVVTVAASPAMAQQSSAAIAENAPLPPAYEVQPNGDVVIEGDVVLADACSMPAVLRGELNQAQFQQALAQCEEFGFSAQPTPGDGTMTDLPDTGGSALLLPVSGLSLVGLGLGGVLLRKRLR